MGPLVILALVVVLWYWPATLLGRLPSEGTVVLGDLPLYSFFASAMESGRVPLWNELSGFGSPVLAEGQIGICYPLHRLLFNRLDVSHAFVVSLIVHTVLAGWWACLCARSFGQSWTASLLVGLIYCGQGFFITQTDHVWAWSTACWLPLAVLSARHWLQCGAWVWLVVLAGVVGLQLLAGHFQVAFFTLVILLLIGMLTGLVQPERRWQSLRRGTLILLAIAAGLVLASIQLAPTAELLLRADLRGRGPEYLQSFSLPPIHLLLGHLAPGCLGQHASTDPILWAPFRSSAGESLCYVGLLPWGLAVWSLLAGWRDREVRLLGLLLACSLAFSLGRFLPGSRWLLELPGFNWFAAPARWCLVSGLFWGLLAGHGLDQIPLQVVRRWSLRLAVSIPVIVIAGLSVIALFSSGNAPVTETIRQLAGHLKMLLPRQTPLLLNLCLLVLISSTALERLLIHRRFWLGLAVVWVIVDLGWTGSLLRTMDFESRDDLLTESPVLQSVAQHEGGRVAGDLGNLPQVSGTGVYTNRGIPDMDRYWTKWVPSEASLWSHSLSTVPRPTRWHDISIRLQNSLQFMDHDDIEFLRLSGIRTLFSVFDSQPLQQDFPLRSAGETQDEWLTQQYFGSDIDRVIRPDSRWLIWKLDEAVLSSRAWLFPVNKPSVAGSDPRLFRRPPPARRRMLETARPLTEVVDKGEQVEVSGVATSRAVLLLSDLHVPGWEAELTTGDTSTAVAIEPAFGDWRSVEIPGPGRFTVSFRYRPESFRVSSNISLIALFAWSVLLIATFWHALATRSPVATHDSRPTPST